MDKLQKTTEQLKALRNGDDPRLKKRDFGPAAVVREKVLLCRTILRLIHYPSVREHNEYGASFGGLSQLLLSLVDDTAADVRLVAEETLVAMFRLSLMDGHASRTHFELYRCLRGVAAGARSTKLSLRTFAHLCWAVRPNKSVVYAHSLVPCLVLLVRRSEELVQEALETSGPDILAVLGRYLGDNHCKQLVKACLESVSSQSQKHRRAGAILAAAVCANAARKHAVLTWLLPSSGNISLNKSQLNENELQNRILGGLTLLKHMMPILCKCLDESTILEEKLLLDKGTIVKVSPQAKNTITEENLLQIFELLLYRCASATAPASHRNAISTAALECLVAFLAHLNSMHKLKVSLCDVENQIFAQRSRILPRNVSYSGGGKSVRSCDSSVAGSSVDLASFQNTTACMTALDGDNDDDMQLFAGLQTHEPQVLHAESSNKTADCAESAEFWLQSNHDAQGDTDDLADCGNKESYSRDCPLFVPDDTRDGDVHTPDSDDMSTFDAALPQGIGTLTDSGTSPLSYCARCIVSRFLLDSTEGSPWPDTLVRVSHKCLALTVLVHLVEIESDILCQRLVPSDDDVCIQGRRSILDNDTKLHGVLVLSEHSDPQLRSLATTLAATYLHNCSSSQCSESVRTLCEGVLRKCIVDESSVVLRSAVDAAQLCLPDLCHNFGRHTALALIRAILDLRSNSYWLLKISIAHFLASLSAEILEKCAESELELSILRAACDHLFMCDLLCAEDARVRIEAAKLMPKLCCSRARCRIEMVDSFTRIERSDNLLSTSGLQPIPPVQNLQGPYILASDEIMSQKSADSALVASEWVNALCEMLARVESKSEICGLLSALRRLMQTYPPTSHGQPIYSITSRSVENGKTGLLSLAVNFLDAHPIVCGDLALVQDVMEISGSLVAGLGEWHVRRQSRLQAKSTGAGANFHGAAAGVRWALLGAGPNTAKVVDQLLVVVFRILGAFYHIVTSLEPPPLVTSAYISTHSVSNTSGASGAGAHSPGALAPGANLSAHNISLSPVRKLQKGVVDSVVGSVGKDSSAKNDTGKDARRAVTIAYGDFWQCAAMCKLYEALKGAYSTHLTNLSCSGEQRALFTACLQSTLICLGRILECARPIDLHVDVAQRDSSVGLRSLEELLLYVRSAIKVTPADAINCVTQLLKCLFGTNLATLLDRKIADSATNDSAVSVIRLAPYRSSGRLFSLAENLHKLKVTELCDDDNLMTLIGSNEYLRAAVARQLGHSTGRLECKPPSSGPNQQQTKSAMSNFIRLFESAVVRSIWCHFQTMSGSAPSAYMSDVRQTTHAAALQLLVQLLTDRVNYALLDTDLHFLRFLYQQLEQIEEGLQRDAGDMLPRLFSFLVSLSYERTPGADKPLINLGSILQLYDSLVAAGLHMDRVCLPVLQRIVTEVHFVLPCLRPASAEITAQVLMHQEVAQAALTKHIHHAKLTSAGEGLSSFRPFFVLSSVMCESAWLPPSRLLYAFWHCAKNLDVVFRTTDNSDKIQRNEIASYALAAWILSTRVPETILIACLRDLENSNDTKLTSDVLKGENGEVKSPETAITDLVLSVFKSSVMRSIKWSKSNENVRFLSNFVRWHCGLIRQKFCGDAYPLISGQLKPALHNFLSQLKWNDAVACHPSFLIQLLLLADHNTRQVAVVQMYESGSCPDRLRFLLRHYFAHHIVMAGSEFGRDVFWQTLHSDDTFHQWRMDVLALSSADKNKMLTVICSYMEQCQSLQPSLLAWRRAYLLTSMCLSSATCNAICAILPTLAQLMARQKAPLLAPLLVELIGATCDIAHTRKEQSTDNAKALAECAQLALGKIESMRFRHASLISRLQELFDPSDSAPLDDPLHATRSQISPILADTHTLRLFDEDCAPLSQSPSKFNRLKFVRAVQLAFTQPAVCSAGTLEKLVRKLEPDEMVEVLSEQGSHWQPLCSCLSSIASEMNLSISVQSALNCSPTEQNRLQMCRGNLHTDEEISPTEKGCAEDASAGNWLSAKSRHLLAACMQTLLRRVKLVLSNNDSDRCSVPEMAGLLHCCSLLLDIVNGAASIGISFANFANLIQFGQSDVLSFASLAVRFFELAACGQAGTILSGPAYLSLALASVKRILCSPSCGAAMRLQPNELTQSAAECARIQVDLLGSYVRFLVNECGCYELKTLIDTNETPFEVSGTDAHTEAVDFWLRSNSLLRWAESSCSTAVGATRFGTLPSVLVSLMRDVALALCRLPCVHWQVRAPYDAFKGGGWRPVFMAPDPQSTVKLLVTPTAPVHCFAHVDVLRQFVWRLGRVGWSSRQQFEESWMALLGVLSAAPVGQSELSAVPSQETAERLAAVVLAVRALGALLVHSLLAVGAPACGAYAHRHRTVVEPHWLAGRAGQSACRLRQAVKQCENSIVASLPPSLQHCRFHVCTLAAAAATSSDSVLCTGNIERLGTAPNDFAPGQFSVETLWSLTGMLALEKRLIGRHPLSTNPTQTDQSASSATATAPDSTGSCLARSTSSYVLDTSDSLDLGSCMHFLLDLYSHWLKQGCEQVPLPLLAELVKSAVLLSDLFSERGQFEWLRTELRAILVNRCGLDELILQWATFGILKATAVLGLEDSPSPGANPTISVDSVLQPALAATSATLGGMSPGGADVQGRQLKTLVDSGLACPHLAVRLFSMHGLLYLLQAVHGADECSALVPPACDRLLSELELASDVAGSDLPAVFARPQSEQYQCVLWATGFHLMLHVPHAHVRNVFGPKFLELVTVTLHFASTPFYAVRSISAGVELLLSSKHLDHGWRRVLVTQVVQRSLQRGFSAALTCVGVMCVLAEAYGAGSRLAQQEDSLANRDISLPSDRLMSLPGTEPTVDTLEQLKYLFHRLSRGAALEAATIGRVLPRLLCDQFAPADVLNRLLAELIAPHQVRHELVLRVLRRLFAALRKRETPAVVCDWALLALPTLLQHQIATGTNRHKPNVAPASENMWHVTVFLLCAVENPQLRHLFPLALDGRLRPPEDRLNSDLFILAVLSLDRQLTESGQKHSLRQVISDAQRTQPNADWLSRVIRLLGDVRQA